MTRTTNKTQHAKRARELAAEMVDKEYQYELDLQEKHDDLDHINSSGICRCLDVGYSRDGFSVYHMLDMESEREFLISEHEIKLEEI